MKNAFDQNVPHKFPKPARSSPVSNLVSVASDSVELVKHSSLSESTPKNSDHNEEGLNHKAAVVSMPFQAATKEERRAWLDTIDQLDATVQQAATRVPYMRREMSEAKTRLSSTLHAATEALKRLDDAEKQLEAKRGKVKKLIDEIASLEGKRDQALQFARNVSVLGGNGTQASSLPKPFPRPSTPQRSSMTSNQLEDLRHALESAVELMARLPSA